MEKHRVGYVFSAVVQSNVKNLCWSLGTRNGKETKEKKIQIIKNGNTSSQYHAVTTDLRQVPVHEGECLKSTEGEYSKSSSLRRALLVVPWSLGNAPR